MRQFTFSYILLLSIAFVLPLFAEEHLKLPNVLLILADDIGYGDFSCYNPQGHIRTLELDRLAATGIRFTNAHSPAALCSPTRYAILTGNYPWRGRNPDGTWTYVGPTQFLPGQKTIGHFLQQAGYRTAMFGKAGIGTTYERMISADVPDFNSKLSEGPIQWGFDYSYIIPRGHQIGPYVYYENNILVGEPSKITMLEQEDHWGRTKGFGIADWDSSAIGQTLTEKATAFIDKHLKQNRIEGKERPFLIHFCSDGAHAPYTPPQTLFGHQLAGATGMSARTDMVLEIDILLRQFVKILKERNLYNNTVIIVTSDNGGLTLNDRKHFGHDAVGGLRGQKGSVWEGGHRVPLIIHWGDDTDAGSVIKPGTVTRQLVGLHDIVATLSEIAGIEPGEDQSLDSVSLLPVLLGKQDETIPIRDNLLIQSQYGYDTLPLGIPKEFQDKPFREYADFLTQKAHNEGFEGIGHAVITNRWKLILGLKDQPEFLVDLNEDLYERTNQISDTTQQQRINEYLSIYQTIRKSKRSIPPLRVTSP
ncbi:MAG: sulfatase-like hydrolase/transferase [Planctomycetaceae bacterium]|jgi:arylsulfatase A-like enzyme|nr:sulfatase-like hydrolase/transferase [Planctomycetaceae bacterium]